MKLDATKKIPGCF